MFHVEPYPHIHPQMLAVLFVVVVAAVRWVRNG